MITVAEAFVTLRPDTAGFSQETERAVTGALAGASTRLNAAGGSLLRTGAMLTAGVTLPLVGVATAAVNTAADYEDSMNLLQAVTGASGTAMKELGKLAIQLGNDLTLPGTSAADAGQAMTELAKAGLSVADTMGAARGVLQLSAAAQIGNAQAATIAANALNSFGLAGTEATRVADLLAATANSSSAEITDVADGFQMASAVFSASGQTIDTLAIAIGELSNAGIQGSDAGTSLKQTLLALQTPSAKARNLMRDVGFAAYDSSGRMKSLREIVENLSVATADLTDKERDYFLGTVFGSDAIRAVNVLLAEGVDGFDAMGKAVNRQGAAADLAAAKNKGFRGALDALKSTIETLFIQFATPVLGFLRQFALGIAGVVGWVQQLDPVLVSTVAAFAGVLALAGPLTLGLGALSVALGFLLTPIGAVVLALAGAAAAFTYLWQTSETFRDIVRSVVDKVRGFLDNLRRDHDNAATGIGQAASRVGEILAALRATFQSAFDAIGAIVETAVSILTAAWERFGRGLVDNVTASFGFVLDILNGALVTLGGVFDLIKAVLTGKWGEAWEAVKQIVSGAWEVIKGIIFLSIESVRITIETIMGAISGIWSTGWNALKTLVSDVWEGIKTAVGAAVEWVRNKIDSLLGPLDEILGKIARLPGALAGNRGPGGFTVPSPGSGLSRRALGGPVSAFTPYLVGERGPELMVPSTAGTVVPNDALGVDPEKWGRTAARAYAAELKMQMRTA